MASVKTRINRNFTLLSTGFLVGMMLGLLMLSFLISYRIDEYQQRITYLETIIEEKDIRLIKLEESINQTKVVIKEIVVNLDFGEEETGDRLTLEKHIREKYNNLLGKEVKSIDIEILAEVVDMRIMKIGDKSYQLHVSRVLLTELLILWIDVETQSTE